MTLGERLRELRQEQGLSQETVAELAEITPTQLSRIELGQSVPRGNTLCRLALVFGMSLAEMMGEADAALTIVVWEDRRKT
jgi:transcriptional regulator with XRE-family HTH domain